MMTLMVRNIGALIVVFLLAGSGFSAALAAESVCLQCHAGLEGRLAAPVAAWDSSIHAQNGISCPDCHGGDPTDFAMAMDPERGFVGVPEHGEIPEFCGRCHVGVKEDYFDSGHGRALHSGGPQCVTCHGNHAVQTASLALINREDCSRCHEYGRAEEIKAAMLDTDRLLAGIQSDLDGLAKTGIRVREMEGETFALRNDFHRLFHTVDVERVREQTAAFQQRGGEIRTEIEAVQEELTTRKLLGAGAAGLLFLVSVICFLIRKTYRDEE